MTTNQPREPRPVIAKIGSFFRRCVGVDPAGTLKGAHVCGMCQEPADGRREWSPHLRAFVHLECIPAIVRAHGRPSIVHWLETGLLIRGDDADKSRVIVETLLGSNGHA